MKSQEKQHQKLEHLLDSAIQVLQDPRCDPTNSSYDIVTSVFSQIDLFNKLFSSPLEHDEFVQTARFYIDHEVFSQGTILMKEKIFADKFFFILRGSAHKTHARSNTQAKSGMNTPKNRAPLDHKSHTEYFPNLTTHANLHTEPQQETGSPRRNSTLFCKSPQNTDRGHTEDYPIEIINTQTDSKNILNKRRGGLKRESDISPESSPSNPSNNTYITQVNFSSFAKKVAEGEEANLVAHMRRTSNDGELSARQSILKHTEPCNSSTIQSSSLRIYHAGDYFGENFHKEHQYKEHGVITVTSEEIHVLTLTRENYKLIMEELSKITGEKVRLFTKLFPTLEESAVHNFSQYFKQKHFKLNEVIYHENDKANGLGIILAGSVNLIRGIEIFSQSIHVPSNSSTVGFGPSRKVEVPMASIVKGQVFGEELLMKKTERKCTAIASTPDTVIYFLDAGFYSIIKTKYAEFFEVIKANGIDKFAWRDKKAADFIELQRTEDKYSDSSNLTKGSPWLKDVKIKPNRHYTIHQEKKLPTETSYTSSNEPETPVKIAHMRTSSLGSKNLEFYKEKFSRKVQAFSPKSINESKCSFQDSDTLSRKNSEKNVKSILVEFNLRKELEDIKPAGKTKLPRLHLRNKSLQLSNMKRVETDIHADSLDTSPRGDLCESSEPFRLRLEDSSPMSGSENSTERSHWTDREKQKLKSVIPVGTGKVYMKGPSGFARFKGLHTRRLAALE